MLFRVNWLILIVCSILGFHGRFLEYVSITVPRLQIFTCFLFGQVLCYGTASGIDRSENFTDIEIVGGISAAVAKTAAAPIERVKLLLQNQVSYHLHLIFGVFLCSKNARERWCAGFAAV